MPLPVGLWKMDVNGLEVNLQVQAAPQTQAFTASIDLIEGTINVFWDEASQTITFLCKHEGASAWFKGYLFRTPQAAEPGQDLVATLAGFAQVEGSILFCTGTSRRNVFGWFAQKTEVI
jgi:hypothetical protein